MLKAGEGTRRRQGEHMLFDLIDPIAMIFLLIAMLGLMLALAYGRM
jgi:hypothetical protein